MSLLHTQVFFFFFSTPETQSRNTYIKVSNKVNKVSNNVKNPGKSLATISAPEKHWRGKQSALWELILTRIKRTSEGEYGFPSSHIRMWELDYKESWALKNWCFWTVVLEKTLGSPLDCKENQPVHPKGDQSWVFIGRTDSEAEAPILWPPDVKNWLTGKDPDAGKDWRWEKGTTEDEMVGWHHWLNGHEFE